MRRICIDPGHQGVPDCRLEPISPGNSKMKIACSAGAEGFHTGVHEHDITLRLALATEELLISRQIDAVLTRRSADVKISNRDRALFANDSHSSLCIKLHCNGVRKAMRWIAFWRRGLETLVPKQGMLPSDIYVSSLSAANVIHTRLLDATGFPNRGITERDNLVGFNWSTIPVVLVELGYLTNPTEESLLGSDAFLAKVAYALSESISEVLNDL